ncbi:MAG: hypothetical protein ACI9XZ_003992, partial [Alphaproteobacteria bacterium]
RQINPERVAQRVAQNDPTGPNDDPRASDQATCASV